MRLSPRGSVSGRPAAPAEPAPPSRLVVHVEMPLAPLQKALEERVPRRLGEGRVRLGPAGNVSYTVERGALSLRVSRTALLIETPVRARAEACRGEDCYASCQPEALVVAEVPLMLRPDYRFERTSVSLRFTRPCKVRALGGLLTLDVTPTLEAQLLPELQKVAHEIDAELPRLEARVAEAWSALSLRRELPLGGCFVLLPYGVVQGPFSPSAAALGGRFAVLARPELRASCGDAPPEAPLPPLQADAALPEEGVLRLGLVTPLATLGRALEAEQVMRVSGKQQRVGQARVTAHGSDVDVQMALAGEVCGDLALSAGLDFSGEGEHIGLARAELWPGERQRVVEGALEPVELTRALAAVPRVTPLLSVAAFRDTAPSLAAGLSRPSLEVRATVSSARAAGAMARGEELVSWLEARGALWLEIEAPR